MSTATARLSRDLPAGVYLDPARGDRFYRAVFKLGGVTYRAGRHATVADAVTALHDRRAAVLAAVAAGLPVPSRRERVAPPGISRCKGYWAAYVYAGGERYPAGYHATLDAALAAQKVRAAEVHAAVDAGLPVPEWQNRRRRPDRPAPVPVPRAPSRNPRCRPDVATGVNLKTLRRYARLRQGDRRVPAYLESLAAVVALCRRCEAITCDGSVYEVDRYGELYVRPYRPQT